MVRAWVFPEGWEPPSLLLAQGEPYRAGRKGEEGGERQGQEGSLEVPPTPKCRDRRGAGTCLPARPGACGPAGTWGSPRGRELT